MKYWIGDGDPQAYNTNNPNSSILMLGYFKDKAKSWLYRHSYLLALYKYPSLRTVTAHLRGLPDFVIIGAQKAGTTSLYRFVVMHPAIAPASKKEMHYFSVRYKFGELWYRSNFPTNMSKRYFYKKTKQKLLSGEATPTYIFYPTVPGRMKKILPDVKLIVILRNPVDRAYSQYQHMVRQKNETLSFEKAIELEEERCAGEKERLIRDPNFAATHYILHSYLARGIYADQLENWFKHYSRKQFLILATDDLRKNPQQTLDQIFDFLGAGELVQTLQQETVFNFGHRRSS